MQVSNWFSLKKKIGIVISNKQVTINKGNILILSVIKNMLIVSRLLHIKK